MFAILFAAALAGCAVGPNFEQPATPRTQRYNSAGEKAVTIERAGVQHFAYGEKVAADWWRLFDCPKLNGLVVQAIANSPNLQAAQAALRQSENNLRAGYGIFYPEISASFQPTRQQFSPARFGETTAPSVFSLYTLSTTVSYVLDIWGGERRELESLGAQVDVQHYNTEGTYLALTGNVVNTMIAAAAYQAEIEATKQIIGFLQEQADLTLAQTQAGVVPYANLLSIQTQLASTEATLPTLRQQLVHARHVLFTLVGMTPGQDWAPPHITLSELSLPSDLPVSLPSDLVRQRPDILVAEAQLHSASAQIGVATAAMFPSITLNASYGWNSTSLSTLFGAAAPFWTVGAGIFTPLIQGPTLWYQRKAAVEAYQQALANYRQTVLAAFAQVADALDALQHDAQALDSQSRALRAAAEALRLIQANYKAGTVNYIQVLIADDQYQQAQINYIQAAGQQFQDTAALFVALGGGWRGNDLVR